MRPILWCAVAALLVGWSSSAFAQSEPTPAQQLEALRADVQGRADHNIYPIQGIHPEDAREVLAGLHSTDRDEWAAAWSAMGQRYADRATAAEAKNDKAAAREDWHQAWIDYMFAGWPVQNTPGKRAAYPKSADAFRHYGALMDPPLEVVEIPFENSKIVGLMQLPRTPRPAPVVISIGGLDEYKEFAVQHFGATFLEGGLGEFAIDMPGTGESPVKAEIGGERVFAKVIDYLRTRRDVDGQRLAVQGVSAGGYWSALLSYVERPRLRAAIVWGGPVHGYFQADWQRKSFATREYLFGLKEARIAIWGFADENSFLAGMPKMSLEARGLLSQPSTAVLAVNGQQDSQVPIDDLYLLMRTGTPKFAWVNPSGGHVGRSKDMPEDVIHRQVIVPWLNQVMAGAQ
ncbi:MAG: alpha/beta hydrolase [Alphaproteobacteria bacterium]|nr:alpha/beta hydrolase [Alphaproteobacteria bacterium]